MTTSRMAQSTGLFDGTSASPDVFIIIITQASTSRQRQRFRASRFGV